MVEIVSWLAIYILHLGVGMAIALHGRLLLAAFVSATIIALPLAYFAPFGTPRELEAYIGLVATPLGAVSLLAGVAGVVLALVRWVQKTKSRRV
jgi:hypothetical protein